MDEKEILDPQTLPEDNDLTEFSLEDIIKEFSDPSDASAEAIAEAPEESREDSPEEATQEEAPSAVEPSPAPVQKAEEAAEEAVPEETEEAPVPEAVTEEPTIRIPQIRDIPQEPPVMEQTIRLDAIPDTQGTVRVAQPVPEEQDAQEAQTEPYSKAWEPEYEQPMGEYIPPPPIIFHPRSRLRELKRKLVAGPEKLYYDLSEKGVGKLQVAIFLSLLVVLVGAISTAMYSLGMIQENRMRLMVFVQFLTMMLSALLGSFQLLEGAGDLLRGRFTRNTLLFFTFIACCADGIICLQQLKVPCCAAFSLEVTMSLWGTYQDRTTRLGQLDTMRRAIRLDSVAICPDYSEGRKGLLRGEGQVEDFMETYDRPTAPEKALDLYALFALLLSIGVGVAAGLMHDLYFGIRAGAVAMLAAMPATIFITVSRPMAILERRLHALGTVLCGWQGVTGLCGKALFPVTHEDLFPAGSIKMNGVKFYTSREPDEIVAYAAAMISADGGSLVPLFTHLLESRNGMHYDVENLRPYDGGGIGGEINQEPVLLGSLQFLQQMGVDIPEGIRISQAVCIAVDGELCGVFAVTYDKVRASSSGLSALCAYRHLSPILTTNDFMLTPSFIRSKFGVNIKRIRFPEHDVRLSLQEKELEIGAQAMLLVTKEGLAPFAYGVAGARSLKTACTAGVVLHILGGAVGLAMMALLALLGAEELLVPGNLFLYQLIWMIPGLMITEWTRTI